MFNGNIKVNDIVYKLKLKLIYPFKIKRKSSTKDSLLNC